MPSVYLSPSLQEWNPVYGGGNEEYYMNLVADAMEPYLKASGIKVVRNSPDQTLRQAIDQSNMDNYDLHFAIHSNAAGAENAGKVQGADFYYYPTSNKGKEAAEILAENYRNFYPNRVQVLPTTSLAEVRQTKAPAVLAEVAYHDNPQEADWIRENIDGIGRNLAKGVADFLGVPFIEP